MQRHIVYPGQIPLDTDILNSIKDSYYGNGWSAESVIGVNTQVVGLAVTPTTPASLQVNVAPGAIYSLQTVDSAAYGSLGTDANQFTKQGILAAGTTLTITPPGTVGQSVNYLVQVAFAETDSTPIILPYYNASNPSVAWSGPNNTGVAQNTVRSNTCVVGLKAGAPAATGSQLTPAPDVGYTGIYVVTVAQGQTTITGGNISQLASAPYFPTLPQIPTGVQNGQWTYAVAGGTANALTATLAPAPQNIPAGFRLWLKVASTNTAAITLSVNGLSPSTVLNGDGTPVTANSIVAGQILDLTFDGAAFRLPNIPQMAIAVQSGQWLYGVAAGAANAITTTLNPAPPALVAGMCIRLKILNNNTAAATLNINGLGAVPIQRGDGTALVANYLVAGQIVDLTYDGSAFRLQNFIRRTGDTMGSDLGFPLDGIGPICTNTANSTTGKMYMNGNTPVLEARSVSTGSTLSQIILGNNNIAITDSSPTTSNSVYLKVVGSSAGIRFDNVGTGANNVAYGWTGSAIAFRIDATNVGSVTPSDKRLKLNVRDIPYSIDDFSRLKFVSYEYDQSKSPIGFPKGMRFGVIANDAEKIIPDFISEWAMDSSSEEAIANTTYKQADYELLIPLMGRYIQELHARLLKLETK